ncbi:lipase/esterase [Rhodopirellula maiorica SM1]|uniref:Lipase/esterase n=1 Tax=Rhodopirellula maiorica SM1 TaxID=1265738 RepID=M5R9Q1_9BACT|nr:alpha/beta hydrolase fold domain-containing protein [Rhodopirellula maiorica]EMI15771.1 lipase/esterase [Rhodopirellula maiorica SM1]
MMNHQRFFLATCCFSLVGIAAAPSHAQTEPQQTSPQFKRLDRNQDGKLTKDEFSGPLFRRIDANQDGVISGEEDQAFTRRAARGQEASAATATSIQTERDLPYAGTDNPRQTLDLYLPKTRKNDKPLPVVVFIHGGGWQNGDKQGGFRTVSSFVETGQYIGVSVGYRLSGEAIWPAQIHDCKAAIRWPRANAERYNLDPDKIGVTGTSAGGHLVAMLGTAGDVPELEGKLGDHLSHSSSVSCVVDQYGPSELLTMGGWHDDANSPESKLVGGTLQESKKAARNASPVSYVSENDPPFLIIHGTDDRVVPFNQSERLHEALSKVGVETMLVPVQGGGHGRFDSPEVAKRLQQFFDKHLLGKEVTIASEPIPQGVRNGVKPR